MSDSEEIKNEEKKTTKKGSTKTSTAKKTTATKTTASKTGTTRAKKTVDANEEEKKTTAKKTTTRKSTSTKTSTAKKTTTTKATTAKKSTSKTEKKVEEPEEVKDTVVSIEKNNDIVSEMEAKDELANSIFADLKNLDEEDIPKSLRKNNFVTDETIRIDLIDFKNIDNENVFKSSNRKSKVAVLDKEDENKKTVSRMEAQVEEEEQKILEEKNGKKEKKKKKNIFVRIFKVLVVLGLLGIMVLAFLLYGPWDGFRDWYITSAMTTMTHQWLATMFYDDETIKEVMARNNVEEIDDITDTSLIKFENKTEKKQEQKVEYANEYEKQVLEREAGTLYKKIDIKGKGYNGYLAFIYDPSKIHTMVTSKINVQGEYVKDMAKREGAKLAINGGGFDDPNYSSNGGTPTGVTVVRGKTVTRNGNFGGVGGIVGFTKDNVLTLGRFSASKAEEMGIRDAVTTSCPFLIINGESTKVNGNGGWGDAARTVIGQRRDGIVLMLVINGRNYATGIIGADMKELIDIMERYGAYNAACLDGGTSTVMVEDGEVINDPIDGSGRHKTRWIPTAFGVFEE